MRARDASYASDVRTPPASKADLTIEAPRATIPRPAPSEPGFASARELPAIVFGGHITALGVVRSLGPLGIPTHLVTGGGDYAARSRWALPLPEGPPESGGPEPLALYLESLPFERAVLFPCSDNWARAVAGLPEALRRRFPSPIAALGTLELFLDKARFAELVEQHAVPHPATAIVGPEHEEALESFAFGARGARFFLKPTDSQRFVRQFGVKALAVSDREEARAGLAEAWAAGMESMLVQEYIPGPASSHYFIDGFVTVDGRMPARLARRRLRMYPPDFGNSTYHVTVPLAEVAEALDRLERLLAAVNYRGIFSAEFKRDARDGELRILEVNVRPWWYVHFATTCGVNVCALAHREAVGLRVDAVDSYQVGARSVLLGADLRAYRYQRGERGIGLLAWLSSWRGARETVISIRDPLPGVLQLKEVITRAWARRRGDRAAP